ncbi:MAG: hypothetical protein EA411_01305 [Saprospirales bacterium]|nr:MAG: hypothetical protein EA411_01305 [Saprospirales bacterium]
MIVLIIALASSPGLAQTTQNGQFIAGGSLSFISVSGNNSSSTTIIQIAPGLGVMATDRLGLGAEINYLRESSDNITSSSYSFSPFVRYYIYKGLFPQFKYVWAKMEDDAGFFSSSQSASGIDISLGYTIFLSPTVALEPSLFYLSLEGDSAVGLRMGFRAFLGGSDGE